MDPIYSVMILVCVIASIGMCFHVQSNPVISVRSQKWFIAVYVCVVIGAAAEFLGKYFDIHPVGREIHLAVKLLEICITPLFPVLIAFGCGIEKSSKPLLYVVIIHAIVEVILLPFGKVIRIDSTDVYRRGEWYGIYISVYVISFVYMLSLFTSLSRRFKNRDLMTLVFVCLAVLCAVTPAMIRGSIRTSFLGITMAAIFLYMYYEGLTMQDMNRSLMEQSEQLHAIQEKLIIGIADLIESRDSSTGTHVKNTASYVKLLTDTALDEGLYPGTITDHFREMMVLAAPLHDIGKLSIPDSILLKPGKLTAEEFEIMKRHAPEGGRIINDLLTGIADDEYRQIAFEIASYHHERWNGTGYPDGLSETDIPVSARIMALADVYDALTMQRVYKEAVSPEKALEIIETDLGKQFDPQLGALFVRVMREKLSDSQ